jgi:hypothetical protein
LKEKISTTPVLALSNLQQPFEIEIDANRYTMGVVLMQYHKPICYHSETFNQADVKYPTYDKVVCISPEGKEMEALLVREGNNHTYKSPYLIVSPSTYQSETISTLQMYGFSTTISFGNQVQKGYK